MATQSYSGGIEGIGRIYYANIDQRIHVQEIIWVAREIQELYLFRHVVPYVQFEVALSV